MLSVLMRIIRYSNPVTYLGIKRYSFNFPFFFTLGVCLASEIYAYWVVHSPNIVGVYIILASVGLLIYFAFRDGILGGVTSSSVSVLYYLYIIYSRHYTGDKFSAGIITTAVLGLLYIFMAGIIGWLKQTIDTLIEHEADERKHLQQIVDQFPIGVLITDEYGKVVQINKNLATILRESSLQNISIGDDVTALASGTKQQGHSLQLPLGRVLSTGKPIVEKEYVINVDEQKRIFLQMNCTVIRNQQGKIIAAVAIINNITQQKELEERKDDFVNMASHELKTPITSMKLYIESLFLRIHTYDDAIAEKILVSIRFQTEKLQQLVSDLLDVSRLQTGKLMFTKEIFTIQDVIKETIMTLQSTTKQKIVYTDIDTIPVMADKFRIYQVITNLITNAIKYSSGEKNIIIKTKKNHKKIIVSVQDFGIGISKSQQNKIFNRLYQVTDSKEKTFPGFGMGLYISKEIINKHNGKIWVESEKGNGSTFYFSLPI